MPYGTHPLSRQNAVRPVPRLKCDNKANTSDGGTKACADMVKISIGGRTDVTRDDKEIQNRESPSYEYEYGWVAVDIPDAWNVVAV